MDLSDTELDAFNLATGEVTVLDGSIAEYATLGFFLRANYDYAGRIWWNSPHAATVRLVLHQNTAGRLCRLPRWAGV